MSPSRYAGKHVYSHHGRARGQARRKNKRVKRSFQEENADQELRESMIPPFFEDSQEIIFSPAEPTNEGSVEVFTSLEKPHKSFPSGIGTAYVTHAVLAPGKNNKQLEEFYRRYHDGLHEAYPLLVQVEEQRRSEGDDGEAPLDPGEIARRVAARKQEQALRYIQLRESDKKMPPEWQNYGKKHSEEIANILKSGNREKE